jgi:hypothetical protein
MDETNRFKFSFGREKSRGEREGYSEWEIMT